MGENDVGALTSWFEPLGARGCFYIPLQEFQLIYRKELCGSPMDAIEILSAQFWNLQISGYSVLS